MIKQFLLTYFSTYPQQIYNHSNYYGNFGNAGIGLGLINSQKTFWISNFIMATTLYSTNDNNIYLFIFPICSYLYSFSFFKTYQLLRLLIST